MEGNAKELSEIIGTIATIGEQIILGCLFAYFLINIIRIVKKRRIDDINNYIAPKRYYLALMNAILIIISCKFEFNIILEVIRKGEMFLISLLTFSVSLVIFFIIFINITKSYSKKREKMIKKYTECHEANEKESIKKKINSYSFFEFFPILIFLIIVWSFVHLYAINFVK